MARARACTIAGRKTCCKKKKKVDIIHLGQYTIPESTCPKPSPPGSNSTAGVGKARVGFIRCSWRLRLGV